MRGYMRTVICGRQVFLYLVSNKTLSIYGSRLMQYCCYGMFLDDFSKESLAHAHGHRPRANWSSSFSPYHTETFCQLPPGVPMLVGYIHKDDLADAAERWGEQEAWAEIQNREFAVFKPEPYQAMLNATYWRNLYPQLDADNDSGNRYMLMMFDLFKNLENAPTYKFKQDKRIQRFNDYLLNQDIRQVTVDDLVKELRTSNKTLIKGCYEVHGDKPMNVIKKANLDQMHRVLTSRGIQEQLGLHSVQQISQHFGFYSRSNTAKSYKQYHGCTPSESFESAQ